MPIDLQLAPAFEFHGPNPFAAAPVVVMRLQLAGGDGRPSHADVRLACERMAAVFPEAFDPASMAGHSLALQLAHCAAHCALALLTEVRGSLHVAGACEGDAGETLLWVEFHGASIAAEALAMTASLLREAVDAPLDEAALQSRMADFVPRLRRAHPDYQAAVLMGGARARDIPALSVIASQKAWQYGWGARSRVFIETLSNEDGSVASTLQRSKSASKALFVRLGLPTPRSVLVKDTAGLPRAAETIGWPCVVKPQQLGGGKGVTADIRDMQRLQEAFAHARQFSREPLLVEAHVPGEDHRLMVLDGKLLAAIRREPSSVTGDGESTVAQLVAELNRPRSRNMVKSRYLRPIAWDATLESHLATLGLERGSVLPRGTQVRLRTNANLSTGGICIDVTGAIHPRTRRLAEFLAQTMGLASAGIDFITTDIARPPEQAGAFIEVNHMPGIDAMIAAGQDPVDLAVAALGDLPGRIPVRLAVVEPSALASVLAALGSMAVPPGAAWACGHAAQVEDVPLALPRSPRSPRAAIEAVLLNRAVQRALFVTSRDELVQSGMPVDKVDRTAVCGPAGMLPAPWLAVLERQSGKVEAFADWTEFAAAGVFTEGGALP
jgi:cyanophycin synthetase